MSTIVLSADQIDRLASECWKESRYSGRDGQDFDHQEFARVILAAAALPSPDSQGGAVKELEG